MPPVALWSVDDFKLAGWCCAHSLLGFLQSVKHMESASSFQPAAFQCTGLAGLDMTSWFITEHRSCGRKQLRQIIAVARLANVAFYICSVTHGGVAVIQCWYVMLFTPSALSYRRPGKSNIT